MSSVLKLRSTISVENPDYSNDSRDEQEREAVTQKNSISSNRIWSLRKKSHQRCFLGWPAGLMEVAWTEACREEHLFVQV